MTLRLSAAETSRLHDAAQAAGYSSTNRFLTDHLRPILTGEQAPTRLLAAWYKSRVLEGLHDERAALTASIERVDKQIHALEPGGLLRGLFQEYREPLAKRLATVEERILAIQQEGPE